MDYWQNLDRAADAAAVYGISQRRSILEAQQQSVAQQRRLADLQKKQLEVEQARLTAEEEDRQQERDRAERQKNARKFLCLLEQDFQALHGIAQTEPETIIHLAVLEHHLCRLEDADVFEELEDIRTLSQLRGSVNKLNTNAVSSGRLDRFPIELAGTYLPVLNRILSLTYDSLDRRLFIHPEHHPALIKDVADFLARVARWKSDLDNWYVHVEQKVLRAGGPETLDTWRDTVKSYDTYKDGAPDEVTGMQAVYFEGITKDFSFNLWKQDSLGRMLVKTFGSFFSSDVNSKSADEAEQLHQLKRELIQKYTFQSGISQFNPARHVLCEISQDGRLDGGAIAASQEKIRDLLLAFDTELEVLRKQVPAFCIDPATNTLNKAFASLADVTLRRQTEISFDCSACGQGVTVSEIEAETQMKCPKCELKIKVPGKEGSKEYASLQFVLDSGLYDLLYQQGSMYAGIKTELQDIASYLDGLRREYDDQCAVLNDVNDNLERGNIISAERGVGALPKKFQLDYEGFENAVRQALQPCVQAHQLVEEARKLSETMKNPLKRMLGGNTKIQELQNKIHSLRNQAVQLPENELRTEMLKLADQAESALRS